DLRDQARDRARRRLYRELEDRSDWIPHDGRDRLIAYEHRIGRDARNRARGRPGRVDGNSDGAFHHRSRPPRATAAWSARGNRPAEQPAGAAAAAGDTQL